MYHSYSYQLYLSPAASLEVGAWQGRASALDMKGGMPLEMAVLALVAALDETGVVFVAAPAAMCPTPPSQHVTSTIITACDMHNYHSL